jgi:thiamine biosynthesis lipoprotein
VFDPTVQTLWRAHREQRSDADAVAAAMALVGFHRVGWDADHVAYARNGMAMTLNGIAQGYITDKVADLLRSRGFTNVLVNLGEYRALGNRPDGRAWQIGIQDPRNAAGITDIVELTNNAVSTSGGYGALIGPEPGLNHLFDPRSGQSAGRYLSVSVVHASATFADGLSTAFSFLSEREILEAAHSFDVASALIVRNNGTLFRI